MIEKMLMFSFAAFSRSEISAAGRGARAGLARARRPRRRGPRRGRRRQRQRLSPRFPPEETSGKSRQERCQSCNFRRSVLGSIDSDICGQIFIFQHYFFRDLQDLSSPVGEKKNDRVCFPPKRIFWQEQSSLGSK